ncbi:hypothetical protein [Actinoplanes sp. G11-F43]|uniref:hypothetical protein n=1 Tax=Actinoplanes sp. G11-F43 TaxID=3424130 RepID=UPI003D345124
MIVNLEPPAERDLPPGSAARMRGRLRRERDAGPATRRAPATRPARHGRIAVAGLVACAVAGAVAVPLTRERPAATIAMGPGELTPALSSTVEDCLNGYPDGAMFANGPKFPVGGADMAVAVEHGGRATAVFLTGEGYLACQRTGAGIMPGDEPSGGISVERWDGTRGWLPGPVQVLLRTSEEADGGVVTATGRISARVQRLVVEHGDGEVSGARLSGGTFGLLSTAGVGPGAALVAYAGDGTEIWRQPFFEPARSRFECWIDPDGVVVHPAPARRDGTDPSAPDRPVITPEAGDAPHAGEDPAAAGCHPAEAWAP